MLPLTMARSGEQRSIVAVHGKADIVRYLASMGFVEGATITVVNEFDGNVIVNVKNARVALSKVMAAKIFV